MGVYDQQEFGDAVRRGWLSEREATGARAGLAELVGLIEAGRLVECLAEVHPFGRVRVADRGGWSAQQ